MSHISETPPRVFVSYSHDSAIHAQRVLALADRLRRDGVDARLDQYEAAPSQGWPRWMLDEIAAADFVLVVVSATYARRFAGHEKPGRGKGVTWEGGIVTQELYDAQGKNEKFLPVVSDADDLEHIPTILAGTTYYTAFDPSGYERLYRHLTAQPAAPAPPLGRLRALPSRPRQQSFGILAVESSTPEPEDSSAARPIANGPLNATAMSS